MRKMAPRIRKKTLKSEAPIRVYFKTARARSPNPSQASCDLSLAWELNPDPWLLFENKISVD
jgi:hypothetical protein